MVNPIGGNPSGVTIPEEEKEEIYKLACQYNFLIVEDDPYYFLSFSEVSEHHSHLPSFSYMSVVFCLIMISKRTTK